MNFEFVNGYGIPNTKITRKEIVLGTKMSRKILCRKTCEISKWRAMKRKMNVFTAISDALLMSEILANWLSPKLF